jgi:glycosyltransferase involved in cell wall biosynthesis
MQEEKIRVLALGDYCCSTGFATVMSNIMMNLQATDRYEIDVVGINYDGSPDYNHERFPGKVYPAVSALKMSGPYGDPYGRQQFLDLLGTGNYDVVFILQDTFIVQDLIAPMQETYTQLPRKFKVVYYFPFDATPKKEWVEKVVSQVDYPVAYTFYAKDEAVKIMPELETKLDVIYHGTNLTDFYPVEKQKEIDHFRETYFAGHAKDRFLMTNVNRNQSRKDIVRNFMILAELRRRGYEQPLLYLHMQHDDQGGNTLVMADHFGFELGKDYIMPNQQGFTAQWGFPVEIVNFIYNSSDIILSTTLGEGWGLSITEAMATKRPIVAPDHTSLTEMMADGRGHLVKAGNTPSLWIEKELDNERLRPLMDVEDAAEKIGAIIDGKAPDTTEKAFEWATQLSWKKICERWISKIDFAAQEAKAATATGQMASSRAARRRAAKGGK